MEDKAKKGFLYSDFYLVLLVTCVFLCWQLHLDIVGMSLLVCIFSAIMCFSRDATPVIPIAIGFMLVISKNHGAEFVVENIPVIFVLVIMVAGSIAVFLYRNKIKFTLGKQFWGLFLMSVALCLGGVLYDVNLTLKSLPSVLSIVGCMLGAYLVFNNIIKHDARYFAKIMLYTGLLLALQTFSFYFNGEYTFNTLLSHKLLKVGWGVSNSIGSLLLLTIPMTLYLVMRTRIPVFYVIMFFVQCLTLLLTLSRGAILMGIIGIPIALIFACVDAKSKKTVIGMVVFMLIIGVILVFLQFKDNLNVIIQKITRKSDSGRLGLYIEGFYDFLKSPIFGLSMYGREAYDYASNIFDVHWYHCTAVQYLANAGAVGFGAYLLHLVLKYKMFLKRGKGTSLRKFLFLGILMWSGYAFIDVGYFSQNQLVFFVIMLVFAEKNVYNSNVQV